MFVEVVSLILNQSTYDGILNPKKAMNLSLVAQLGVASCFCLTSIFLRHFAVVGFQLLMTALINVLFAVGAFWIINKQPDSMSVGATLGSGVIISILSLITAVYWGELSRCEAVAVAIRKYTCDSKGAMRFLCLFSVILFMLQMFFTFYLGKYKGHILAEALQYSELPGADESDNKAPESLYQTKQSSQSWANNTKESERDSLIV